MFLEGANRIGGGREGDVVELHRAIGYGGNEEGFVGLRPSNIVGSVSSVEENNFGSGAGRGEVEDMDATVAENPKILGGGDRYAGLEEGAELHSIAIERGFEEWHFLGVLGIWKKRDLSSVALGLPFLVIYGGCLVSGSINPYSVVDLDTLVE